jgi:hypothetical protein
VQRLAARVYDLAPQVRQRLFAAVTGLENLCVCYGGVATVYAKSKDQRKMPRMPTAAQCRSTDAGLLNELTASLADCRAETSIAGIIRRLSSADADRCVDTVLILRAALGPFSFRMIHFDLHFFIVHSQRPRFGRRRVSSVVVIVLVLLFVVIVVIIVICTTCSAPAIAYLDCGERVESEFCLCQCHRPIVASTSCHAARPRRSICRQSAAPARIISTRRSPRFCKCVW